MQKNWNISTNSFGEKLCINKERNGHMDRGCFVGPSVFCCPNNMEISILWMKWEIIMQLFELTMTMQCHDLFIEKNLPLHISKR